MKQYFVNGQFLPAAKAKLGVEDIGLLRGFGIFDFFSVRGGKPLFMDFHLQRFIHSAEGMGLAMPLDFEALKKTIHQLLLLNNTFDAGIRLVLTGGYSPNSYLPTQPNFFILEQNFSYPDQERYRKGVSLLFHQYTREIPEVKTTNYVVPILQAKKLQEAGAFDLLYHDGQEVSESSRSNFFAVLPNQRILTPNRNILKGITRQHVLEVAQFTNYTVAEGPLSLSDLAQAEEAFLTSTIKGILPVVQIDGQWIGNGKIGAVTQELMAYWEDYVDQYLEALPLPNAS